jgi:hypothetical protein
MPPKLYWQSVQLSSLLTVPVALALALAAGCDSDGCSFKDVAATAGSAAGPRTPVPVVEAPPVAGGEVAPKADPPAPAGDLQAEIDSFTTVAACIESRTKVDPLLGDALEAIGYDTFLSDACEVIDAAKSRDAKRCASIEASALREHCETTVAEIAGDAAGCPWAIVDRPREGRDPACLAIALRDSRLCAGVIEARARATCEAVAAHDPKTCERLGGKATAQCERSARRWARALGPARRGEPLFSSSERVTYVQASAGASAAAITVDLHSDVQRGLVLVQSSDGMRLHAGTANDELDLIGPAPNAGASFSFELFVPAGGGTPVVERAALRVPGHLPVTWNGPRGSMQAKLPTFEPSRAGTVRLTLEGDAKDADATDPSGVWHVHADVQAFVRDTVLAVDLLQAGSHDRGGRPGE